jgi:hypothetical protein
MAKAKTQTIKLHIQKPRNKRPGVHSKTKASKLKSSKNYIKAYQGQG